MTPDRPDEWTRGLPPRLELPAGEEARFTLVSASGAGNQWTAEQLDGPEDVAEVRIELGLAPLHEGAEPQTYGVPELLVVRALRPGAARWRLRLARPWSPDQPMALHDLEVVVPSGTEDPATTG